jgi:hypothetical protein
VDDVYVIVSICIGNSFVEMITISMLNVTNYVYTIRVANTKTL